MSNLITIIITTSWIVYGLLNFYQCEDDKDDENKINFLVLHIIFAPLLLLIRILIGIFCKRTIK